MKVMSTTTRHFMKPLTISNLIVITVLIGNSKNGFAQARCSQYVSPSTWNNCIGTATYPSGGQYVGEFRDGKKNGQGTLTLSNGKIMEGIWENGKFGKSKGTRAEEARAEDTRERVTVSSSGSGFAVSSMGHVITNYHVIDGCQEVRIHNQGNLILATLIAFDPNNDLALLKGDFRPLKALPLSRQNPTVLQDVYVAGYPFGRRISDSIKVTKGIISSLMGMDNNFSNMQIDASLNSGNSGGPILDEKGNIVGVAVSKLDSQKAEGISFGIKMSMVRNFLESNNISLPNPNTSPISKANLRRMIFEGTYYLSCWMTMAQIEKMKSEKVFFKDLTAKP